MKNVRYEKGTRERAKALKKWLITVAVDGRHIGDDSCCVQLLADLSTARRISKLALDLLKHDKAHRRAASALMANTLKRQREPKA